MQLVFEYKNFKDVLIEYKCNKIFQHKFDEKLNERPNTYKLSNHDNDKFILLLWKGVYPYEYLDDWEKFNETFLPGKRRLLQPLKHDKYYWCRLRAHEKSLKRFWNKKFSVQDNFYCKLMYLKILEVYILKYISWILQKIFQLLD